MPHDVASPTATAPECGTTGHRSRCPSGSARRLRPGVVAIPFGWWSAAHPDGKVANSLTNDTLTDWGGGVAYSDTLVEVAAATRPVTDPVARRASRVPSNPIDAAPIGNLPACPVS